MDDQTPMAPLEGVSSPLSYFPQITSTHDVVSIMFTVIFLLWAVYTVVAIYHWVRYGHKSWLAVPTITLHIVVSAALMIFATSGFK